MSRTFAIIVIAALTLSLAGCTIFGKPSRCTERSASSFATFLDEEWTEYCRTYNEHVNAPANFSLAELTEFFGQHPQRVEELNKTLYRFEKYETCFQSPKEELMLRELESCLQDNDETDLQITNAWRVSAQPWIEELEFQVSDIQPHLNDAEREAKRQLKKAAEAFDFNAKMEKGPYREFAGAVEKIDADLKRVEGIDQEFKRLVELARGHDALSETMLSDVRPQINAIAADVQGLRDRWKTLEQSRRFLEFATHGAGVKCPDGVKRAREESRVANRVVEGRVREVGKKKRDIRISKEIVADEKGPVDLERFEGFVCAIRQPENQFNQMPRLCGQYRFVIERQKGSNVDSWEPWLLKSFEESGPEGSVDCALMK